MPTSNIAAVCFALFVFAGYYKAADFLHFVPIDLTLLFAAVTSVFCGIEVWRTRSLGPGLVPMLLCFLAMTVGLHWPEQFDSYASQKELRLFSITALSAFAPLVLLRTEKLRRTFAVTVCLIGLLMAAVATIDAATHGLSLRATAFNANPILLARASGFAGLVLCLFYWRGRLSSWVFIPAALIAVTGLLASGTKAPLIGLLLTVFAVVPVALVRGGSRKRIWGTLAAGCVGLAGTLALLAQRDAFVVRRIMGPLTGEWTSAGESRLALWWQTLELLPTHPFGIGWGHFNEWIQVFENKVLMQHPHNIALEIFVEAGWLAGAAFLALAAISLYRTVRAPRHASATTGIAGTTDMLVVPAVLMYWLVCAAFSGDVNDNRPLWTMLGMALAACGAMSSSRSDGLEDAVDLGEKRKPLSRA